MQEILLGLGLKRPGESEGIPFKGEIIASPELLGTAIANQIGLTNGIAQHDDAGWLVFDFEGKTLLVAKRPFRHSLSWIHINNANAIYGDREIIINGLSYKIRLLRGYNVDPARTSGNKDIENSEWNRLFYPLVPEPFKKPEGGISSEGIEFGSWADYTEEDLVTARDYGPGSVSWCQETDVGNGTWKAIRGGNNIGVGLIRASRGTQTTTSDYYAWRPVLELVRTTSEPQDLFLGEVSTDRLITGDALATQIGLTAGTAFNSTEPWLQFLTKEGQILYVAKKPYRHSVSWEQIHAVDAVYGDKEITIGAKRFKVRLLKGASSDPGDREQGRDAVGSWGSEWNRLFYPLVPNPNPGDIPPVSGEGIRYGQWANYTEAELGIGDGLGHYNWHQEKTTQAGYGVVRGYFNVNFYLTARLLSYAYPQDGWRPVLELIP